MLFLSKINNLIEIILQEVANQETINGKDSMNLFIYKKNCQHGTIYILKLTFINNSHNNNIH